MNVLTSALISFGLVASLVGGCRARRDGRKSWEGAAADLLGKYRSGHGPLSSQDHFLLFSYGEDAVGPIRSALADPGFGPKLALLHLLSEMGNRSARTTLTWAMERLPDGMRWHGTAALLRMPLSFPPVNAERDAALSMLRSSSASDREWAADLLQACPQTPEIARALMSVAHDPGPYVRREAIRGLFQYPGPETRSLFRAASQAKDSTSTLAEVGLSCVAPGDIAARSTMEGILRSYQSSGIKGKLYWLAQVAPAASSIARKIYGPCFDRSKPRDSVGCLAGRP